jgi:hypothetical protein
VSREITNKPIHWEEEQTPNKNPIKWDGDQTVREPRYGGIPKQKINIRASIDIK